MWRAKQQTPCRAEAELVFLIVNGKQYYDGYDFLEGLVLAPGRDGTLSRWAALPKSIAVIRFLELLQTRLAQSIPPGCLKG